MASRSGTSHGQCIPIEEAIHMIQDQESGNGGYSDTTFSVSATSLVTLRR